MTEYEQLLFAQSRHVVSEVHTAIVKMRKNLEDLEASIKSVRLALEAFHVG